MRSFPFRTHDGREGVVRTARARDARACLRITSEAMRERPRTLAVVEDELWTPREWRTHLIGWDPRGASLVAQIAGDVVGQLSVHRGQRAFVRHTAEFGIVVRADARGSGVGRGLIRGAEAWAAEFGIARMALTVFAANERARALYASLGYEQEGVERGGARFPEGPVDVIRMAKFMQSDAGHRMPDGGPSDG